MMEQATSYGKAMGPPPVRSRCPIPRSSLPPPRLKITPINGVLYLQGSDNSGFELWRSDGTAAGTFRISDANPSGSSSPMSFANVNGTLFFVAHNFTNGFELWKTDGTMAGTSLVKDIQPGTGSSLPTYLTNVGGTLFFAANDGTSGGELWKSDGTATGTVMVKSIAAGLQSAIHGFSPRSTGGCSSRQLPQHPQRIVGVQWN